MGFFDFLNHWWNFPFLVMLGLVAVFLLLQLVGMLGHHADVDHAVDHDVAHEGDVHHEHDVDSEHGGGVLSFLGVGRVPFMVVWVTLFLVGGFLGLIVNRVAYLETGGGYPGWAFAVAVAASVAGGLAAVAVAARLAGKLVDTGGKGATGKGELRGKIGVVASAHLDERFGEVRVDDGRGNEMIVHARVEAGEPALAHGDRVVLVDYDPERDLFWATASPVDVPLGQRG